MLWLLIYNYVGLNKFHANLYLLCLCSFTFFYEWDHCSVSAVSSSCCVYLIICVTVSSRECSEVVFQHSSWVLCPVSSSHYLVPALPLTSQCCFLVSQLMQCASVGLLFPATEAHFLAAVHVRWPPPSPLPPPLPPLPLPHSPPLPPPPGSALAILPRWDSSTEACKISCRASPAEASGHSRC